MNHGAAVLLLLCVSGGLACNSGRDDPDCVPSICGQSYECTTLDQNGQPTGAPFFVTLHVNSWDFCTSANNDSEDAIAYLCDGGVETSEGNVISNWTATSDGYRLCPADSAAGCNRCVMQ